VFEYLNDLFKGPFNLQNAEEYFRLLKSVKKYYFHKNSIVRCSFYQFVLTISHRLKEHVASTTICPYVALTYSVITEVA
jgi:hypothetical protein